MLAQSQSPDVELCYLFPRWGPVCSTGHMLPLTGMVPEPEERAHSRAIFLRYLSLSGAWRQDLPTGLLESLLQYLLTLQHSEEGLNADLAEPCRRLPGSRLPQRAAWLTEITEDSRVAVEREGPVDPHQPHGLRVTYCSLSSEF